MIKKINTPLDKKIIGALKPGEEISLSGIIYTARDQAHQRLVDSLNKRKKLPINLSGQVIYYCGPTKTPKGRVIGSCGPTTSKRMDGFTPALLEAGLLGMIGKGERSKQVTLAIKKKRAVYFLAYAGCAALLSQYVLKAKVIAYQDLGPEAIYRLEVKDLPLIVGIDPKGKSVFKK